MRATTRIAAALLALIVAVLAASGAQRTAYQLGQQALDRRDWPAAIRSFDDAVAAGGATADDALYWKAYAQQRAGRVNDALTTIGELRRSHPDSPWIDDAEALQAEMRGPADRRAAGRAGAGDETTLIALAALAESGSDDPRVVETLTRFIRSDRPLEQKERAMFVLMQSGAPGTLEAIIDVARSAGDPELRGVAVRQLGISGDDRAADELERLYGTIDDESFRVDILNAFMVADRHGPILAAARSDASPQVREAAIHLLGVMDRTSVLDELYAAETSPEVRATMLQAYMIAGDRARVLEAARGESTLELRVNAVHLLGAMDGTSELMTLWSDEEDTQVRRAIVQALAVAGATAELTRIARGDAPTELRLDAIRGLGIAGDETGGAHDELVGLYETSTDAAFREAVLDGLFMADDVDGLLAIARTETDPALRAAALQRLGMTGSEKATTYLLDLLDE